MSVSLLYINTCSRGWRFLQIDVSTVELTLWVPEGSERRKGHRGSCRTLRNVFRYYTERCWRTDMRTRRSRLLFKISLTASDLRCRRPRHCDSDPDWRRSGQHTSIVAATLVTITVQTCEALLGIDCSGVLTALIMRSSYSYDGPWRVIRYREQICCWL